MHTIKDIHKDYLENVEDPIETRVFKQICEQFNMQVIDMILDGKQFSMGNNLSTLSVRLIERNPSKPTINWWESNKYKQELLAEGKELYNAETEKGEKWFIYYTDPWYCKYHWQKSRCKLANKTAYRFTPTRGIKGNKEKLTALLKTDDLAYLRFKKHGNV
ncbi:hypothetical protein OAA26_00140 [bacterium]|nr:hypothetical protein [bacterium]|tara:strand:+ start:2509 stop:2991 length:483 start_codon:yes stop_codon:yes gene_type:complete